MSKTKYAIISGFLGAGKTTSMITFAQVVNQSGGKAAILANDLGAKDIVDAAYTSTTGILTGQIAGDCICYQHEVLVSKLRGLAAEGADIIFSDIPGCGIGALEHVYLQLGEREPGEFDLLPFTCVVDPRLLRLAIRGRDDGTIPKEMQFLLRAQMAEAELIVLNKTDLLEQEEQERQLAFLRAQYSDTPVMAMSALTGDGVGEVLSYLVAHRSAMEYRDIGYGSEAFLAAEQLLCWFNRRVFFETADGSAADFNLVAGALFQDIGQRLQERGSNVPHLKLFAMGVNGDFLKASMTGVGRPVEYGRKLQRRYAAISMMINARALSDSQEMAQVADEAIALIQTQFHLKSRTYFSESFGMMDEGRGDGGRASRYD